MIINMKDGNLKKFAFVRVLLQFRVFLSTFVPPINW